MYLFVICCLPIHNFAQNSEVKKQVEQAEKHNEDARKEIKLAMTILEDCDNTHSIDLIHRNVNDAKKYVDRAKRIIGYAKDKANATIQEATDIDCSAAISEATAAEDYFNDAKRKLSSAFGNLSAATYIKKDLDLVNQALSDAETDIERALKKMNDAVNKLGAILTALKDCNKE